jgi:hypothetical protein
MRGPATPRTHDPFSPGRKVGMRDRIGDVSRSGSAGEPCPRTIAVDAPRSAALLGESQGPCLGWVEPGFTCARASPAHSCATRRTGDGAVVASWAYRGWRERPMFGGAGRQGVVTAAAGRWRGLVLLVGALRARSQA